MSQIEIVETEDTDCEEAQFLKVDIISKQFCTIKDTVPTGGTEAAEDCADYSLKKIISTYLHIEPDFLFKVLG